MLLPARAPLVPAFLAVLFAAAGCAPRAPAPAPYAVEEKSIAALQADMASGVVSSAQLVQGYLDRIARLDRAGPALRSVIAADPDAAAEAAALDVERRERGVRGPLHGVPILIKDNIETAGALATTAGSLALRDNVTERDAHVVARLRAAGAVILGKTNLSEWANIRSDASVSGWSALGGQTRNPYALDRSPCGSSSGSGAAAAASLAAAAIGTETDGSIVCPASVNGLVGVKPTLGLVSRTHIIPIALSQDTAGPMARSVADAALLLTVMAGTDPEDPATAEADARKSDYSKALDAGALAGKRIGVARFLAGYNAGLDAEFARALEVLKAAGATLIEIAAFPNLEAIGEAEFTVLMGALKGDLNAYLASRPRGAGVRTLAEVIAFNAATPAETALFGQTLFEKAEAHPGPADPGYQAALAKAKRLAGPEGIDALLRADALDALVAPTGGPAWRIDVVNGDHFQGSASGLPAVAGYPHVTVPMGAVRGLPVGLSFIGPAWSEARLLALAFAFEQRTKARKPPFYAPSVEQTPAIEAALAP